MRYTAKARMLSFDFLTDPVVYGLPHDELLVLVGMIARADNLGRLPGEPGVLRAFLFYPKAPRADVTDEVVARALATLSDQRNARPVIRWYVVDSVRYVEFMHWEKHQTIKSHARKSTYPGPERGRSCAPFTMGDASEADEPPRGGELPEADGSTFDEDVVSLVAVRIGIEFGAAVAFARWLWSTGVRRMDLITPMLEHLAEYKPDNPHAYYAPGSAARDGIIARASSAAVVRAHELTKEDR